MSKRWIESLYDAAKSDNQEGELSKFDEQKLRRHLESNNKLFSRNKDVFYKEEPKFSTCSLYNPCPICDKCLNKASHLYVRCQNCKIPICVHKYIDRDRMIKRYNFRCVVEDKVYEELEEKYNEIVKGSK